MKKTLLKLLKSISAMSFGIAVLSANSPSSWIIHEPEMPQDINKLKRQ